MEKNEADLINLIYFCTFTVCTVNLFSFLVSRADAESNGINNNIADSGGSASSKVDSYDGDVKYYQNKLTPPTASNVASVIDNRRQNTVMDKSSSVVQNKPQRK